MHICTQRLFNLWPILITKSTEPFRFCAQFELLQLNATNVRVVCETFVDPFADLITANLPSINAISNRLHNVQMLRFPEN